jgi:outer membrane protein
MKKFHLLFIYLLLAGTFVFSSIIFFRTKKQTIACIDTARVLKSYKDVAALSASIENKKRDLALKLDTLASEFQTAVKAYEKIRPGLSEKEMQAEQKKLRKKQEEYAQFNSSNEGALKKEEMAIIENALKEINVRIQHYAVDNSYSAVFGVTPTSGIVYASDYVDITEDVIKIINQ